MLLTDHYIHAQNILCPAVACGGEYLRITLSPDYTENLAMLVNAVEAILTKLRTQRWKTGLL